MRIHIMRVCKWDLRSNYFISQCDYCHLVKIFQIIHTDDLVIDPPE